MPIYRAGSLIPVTLPNPGKLNGVCPWDWRDDAAPLWAVGSHGRGGTLSPSLTPNLTCTPKTGPHFRLAWWAGGGPEGGRRMSRQR